MEQSTPFWRNPYVWGFLIGIVALTAMRPLLRRDPPPPPVLGRLPVFELIDQDGNPFGTNEMAGKVWVVDFIFTRCRTFCPIMSRRMAKLQEGYDLYEVGEVGLLSITVDPEYDTPEVLAGYAETHGADPRRWRFLTGPGDEIYSLVVDGFKLHVARLEPGGDDLVDIAHSQKLILVDGQGNIRGYYDSDEEGVDEVFHRSRHVVREQKKGA